MSIVKLNIDISDEQLLLLIQGKEERGIDLLFRKYYKICVSKAYNILADSHMSEDIVQELFSDFWQKADHVSINQSLSSYLQRATYNRSLNYIKSKKLNFEELDDRQDDFADNSIEGGDIKEDLLLEMEALIEELPEKCRIVFSMAKFEHKTYAQIAEELDISVKTVENQISKALKFLKNNLKK